MPTRYLVRLYSLVNQSLVAVFDDWTSLTVERRLNNFSTHTLSMNSRDDRVALFETDAIVEVQRNNEEMGIDWATEYIGYHRTSQFQLTEGGRHIFTSYGRSLEDLLRRRALLYKAPYLKSGPADDVMKTLVDENAGPSALTPARLRDGAFLSFAVAAPQSLAPPWEGSRAYRNLLEVLQEIAAASGVDFAVELTTSGVEFRTYFPQKGVDRTVATGVVPLVFSPEFGNMGNATYVKSRTEEATVVLVTGQGEEAARQTELLVSPAAGDSAINDIEITHDARNEATAAALLSTGASELAKNAAKENFTFDVIQTPASFYGKHYFLGDLVTVVFADAGIQLDKKIVGVNINVADGKESLKIIMGDVDPLPTTFEEAIQIAFRNLIRRLRAIEYGASIQ